jgi:dCMP deaminase
LGEAILNEDDVKYFIRTAEQMSHISNATRLKVGCVITTQSGTILGSGINRNVDDFFASCEDENGLTKPVVIHAEEDAISTSWASLSGSIAFITHAPCLHCALLLKRAGTKKVYYANDYRKLDGVRFLMKHGIEVIKL